MNHNQIYQGNCLDVFGGFPDDSVDCCVTSPPYWGLRDYGSDGQFGLEPNPEKYVENMVLVFREVRRVLKPSGTLWLNLGDTYSQSGAKGSGGQKGKQATNKGSYFSDIAKNGRKVDGLKPKDLVGIPWMVAFALRSDGWYLRQDIIWHKPNPMPESVTDRCTKSHEYIFLMSKNGKYYYDNKAIQEKAAYDGRKDTVMKGSEKYKDGFGASSDNPNTMSVVGHERWNKNDEGDMIRNKRSVWTVNTHPYKDAHFATYPQELIVDCIKAGCPEGGVVLDPFMGAGTTAVVARKLNRNYVGIELNQAYIDIANNRLRNELGMFL